MNIHAVHSWLDAGASWSLGVSIAIALPAFIVLAVSHLRLIPARWCALLSALILVRLLVPWALPVGWKSGFEMTPRVAIADGIDLAAMPAADDAADGTRSLMPSSAGAVEQLTLIWPWVWMAGLLTCLAWLGWSQLWLSRRLCRATEADDDLRCLLQTCCRTAGVRRLPTLLVVRGLETVGMLGWLRPKLLVPPAFLERHSRDQAGGILLHELQHLKRRDGLWTWLGLVACALHWFNPMAWLLFRKFCADRELACDESVVRRLPAASRRSYGEALVKTAERFVSSPALLPSFSVKPSELKHRIQLIMKPQPKSVLLQAVAATICLGIAAFTFTTANADEEREKPAEREKASAEEQVRKPARDGERAGERERRNAPRDEERPTTRERDAGNERNASRDREGERGAIRDGEGERRGPRDGEIQKRGPRDGEGDKRGARDGDGERKRNRDGDAEGGGSSTREGESGRDGDRRKMRDGGDEARSPEKARSREGESRESAERPPESASKTRLMVLSLDAEGNVVTSEGRTVPIDEVRTKLQSIIAGNPDQPFSIRASDSAPLERVMQVMQAAKDAGVKNITLGNR